MMASGRDGGFTPSAYIIANTVPLAPLVSPAFVQALNVSLIVVFRLRIIFETKPLDLSEDSFLASFGQLTANIGAIGSLLDFTLVTL